MVVIPYYYVHRTSCVFITNIEVTADCLSLFTALCFCRAGRNMYCHYFPCGATVYGRYVCPASQAHTSSLHSAARTSYMFDPDISGGTRLPNLPFLCCPSQAKCITVHTRVIHTFPLLIL